MSASEGHLVAKTVADAITAAGWIPTTHRKRWPKYAVSDLDTLRADVVREFPVQIDPHDRQSTVGDYPIAIVIQERLPADPNAAEDRADILDALVESVAQWLALTPIDGIGQPIEPLELAVHDDLIDDGHYLAELVAVYRVFRMDE